MRTLMLWCPDWPVTAAGLVDGVDTYAPVAVLHANRVLACSAAARVEGVRRGLRKREAQARCPQLVVIEHDPGRDARAFEPVVAAVEEITPGVEVIRPGVCAVAAKGPVGYYGGEEQAAERLVEHIALQCGVAVQAGIADGTFAALLAARSGQLVPTGQTAEFLAGIDVSTLDRPELVDLLRRLGIRTLGDFAALPAGDVLARFGFDAAYAHRLAAGDDDRPLVVRSPPPDLTVTGEYDPPLERVDMAAFAARALADRLNERLAAHGLAATRLGIEAHTAAGEELYRVWRHDGLLDAVAIADRVRWQLDGWLTGSATRLRARGGVFSDPSAPGQANGSLVTRPTAGIDRLRLVPDGLVRCAGMQPGLWGELGEADARAHRALHRVQGLLGPESVYTAVLGGGRGYAERVRLIPWGDERKAEGTDRPWPGRLPTPAPATVLTEPIPVDVCTADGAFLQVDERLALSGSPATVRVGRGSGTPGPGAAGRAGSTGLAGSIGLTGSTGLAGLAGLTGLAGLAGLAGATLAVTGWTGPWPVDERWWAPDEANQSVRLQLGVADGVALLVAGRGDTWWLEAIYD